MRGELLKGKEEEANCVDLYSCSTGILPDGGRRDKNDLKKKKKWKKRKVRVNSTPLSKDSRGGEEKKRQKLLVPLD